MDKDYIDRNNIIERYLLHQLTDEERHRFRTALLFDPKLREEVENTRLLYRQIKASLAPRRPRAWYQNRSSLRLGLLVLLTAAVLIWLALPKPPDASSASSPDMPERTTIAPKQPTAEAEQKAVPKQPAAKADAETVTAPRTKKQQALPKPDMPQPIARLEPSYAPHPYLDQFTDSYNRNGQSVASLTRTPDSLYRIEEDGSLLFQLGGQLRVKGAVPTERFVVRIFSNKLEDFDRFRPLYNLSPAISIGEGEATFSTTARLQLQPGLYYYLLEDNEAEDLIYTGKFIVE